VRITSPARRASATAAPTERREEDASSKTGRVDRRPAKERRLCLGASVKEDTREALLCLLQAGLPEDRLADPRLAGEDKRAGTLAGSIQEHLDRAELLVPPDDLHGSSRHCARLGAVVRVVHG
jgi:hypothetical protein